MAKIKTVNDLIKYMVSNNIEFDKEITIGVEEYHTFDNLEKELNIDLLPNGTILIAEIKKEPEQEYGFTITETRVKNIKVSACSYDEAYDIAERLMNNNELDMDDNSYIDSQEIDDCDTLEHCEDYTEES